MKLPGRDYPIGHMTAEELDLEAAKCLREARRLRTALTADTRTFERQRQKRSQLVYGHLLCTAAAQACRKHDADQYRDLSERQMRRVIKTADGAMQELAGQTTNDIT